jgi:hypothetical protein
MASAIPCHKGAPPLARGVLQVFQIDVTKVDRNVAYVAIVVYVCCKGLLPMFHLFFSGRMLQLCLLSGCCICFTHTLHVFYMNVAYGCNGFQVFSGVFFVFSVSSTFTLLWLYLDVSKTNWVLHLSSSPFAASSRYRRRRPLPLLSLRRRGPTWSARNRVQRAGVRSDVRYFLPLISLRIYAS